MRRKLTAIIEREGDWYVALCPELDIASQGATVEQARDNLREALELFFETASAEELQVRLSLSAVSGSNEPSAEYRLSDRPASGTEQLLSGTVLCHA